MTNIFETVSATAWGCEDSTEMQPLGCGQNFIFVEKRAFCQRKKFQAMAFPIKTIFQNGGKKKLGLNKGI